MLNGCVCPSEYVCVWVCVCVWVRASTNVGMWHFVCSKAFDPKSQKVIRTNDLNIWTTAIVIPCSRWTEFALSTYPNQPIKKASWIKMPLIHLPFEIFFAILFKFNWMNEWKTMHFMFSFLILNATEFIKLNMRMV